MAIVTSKGQITLPKAVRDALGLTPGSQVEFALEPGRLIVRKRRANESPKPIPDDAFEEWQGYLEGKLPAASVDELMELLRGERLPPEGERCEDRA